jgi:hypothetical protein
MANTERDTTTSVSGGDPRFKTGGSPGKSFRNSTCVCSSICLSCQFSAWLARCPSGQLLFKVIRTVDNAVALHRSNGGSTVSLNDGSLAGQPLFAVSIYPEQTRRFVSLPSDRQLLEFVTANLELLLQPDSALGTWFNASARVHMVDIVVTLRDRDAALRMGARFDQLSIFDLASMQEIVVGHLRSVEIPRG